jgi:hypothetical protein
MTLASKNRTGRLQYGWIDTVYMQALILLQR